MRSGGGRANISMKQEPSTHEVVRERIAAIYTAESPRVLATLIRLLGGIDAAEEALQEAFRAALTVWPRDGVPANPRAWLISTGRFKGIDAIRRAGRGVELIRQQALDDFQPSSRAEEWDGGAVRDDLLRLVFTCCHPKLSIDGQVALCLRLVCGLTTEEVARAFVVPFETMKKRISRAKATIRKKRIPYEVPPRSALAGRLDAVLHVVYLVYNEGYSATSGASHLRRDLASQAVALGRSLAALLPEPEVLGLLALLLLHESRAAARVDAHGDPIRLDEQDRMLWDQQRISEGLDLLRRARGSGRLGIYTIQAEIASVHATAKSVETTNWETIVRSYDMLVELRPSPIIAFHRAVAVGMRDGPMVGRAMVVDLLRTAPVSGYHWAHAAHADFALRAGRTKEARDAYQRALELVRQDPERRYLERALARATS